MICNIKIMTFPFADDSPVILVLRFFFFFTIILSGTSCLFSIFLRACVIRSGRLMSCGAHARTRAERILRCA